MDRQIRPLRHHIAESVEDPARIVTPDLQKRRIRGLGEDNLHLLGGGIKRVLDHLKAGGIGPRPAVRRFYDRVEHGSPPMQPNIAAGIDAGDPAGRHDDPRIHRFDDPWAGEAIASL
jgi:hypothetical protein